MKKILTAVALAIAIPAVAHAQATPAPAANPPAHQMQMGQMDHSKMGQSKMDHSKMGQMGDGCCKQTADGKMVCNMPGMTGAAPSKRP